MTRASVPGPVGDNRLDWDRQVVVGNSAVEDRQEPEDNRAVGDKTVVPDRFVAHSAVVAGRV